MHQPPLPAFHVMAKPTGARCNLACAYCFYAPKSSLYPHSGLAMSDAIMERYIRQTIRGHRAPEVTIAWQGGEPTLMGLDFFRRAVAVQKRHTPRGVRIVNTLQTNGVLLDERWCDFLAENRFLVGLSVDGPRQLHDAFRRDKRGASVFDRVVAAAGRMRRRGVEFNILCTVNAANCQQPLEVYRFFRDELEANYLQFIPIVERDTAQADQSCERMSPQTVPAESYGQFLIAIFDEWVRRDVGAVFVQFFDGVLASYVRGCSTLCVLQPVCGQGVALEHNGDVYACDHFVEPEYLLGNIREVSIDKLVGSERQREFGQSKSATLPSCCRQCEFLFTCYGECPKNRLLPCEDGSGMRNWLCAGLKLFFSHVNESMRLMTGLLRSGRAAAEIMAFVKQPSPRPPV